MSKISFDWNESKPTAPDVYTTRRGKSSYHTLRYWDGEKWYEIAYSKSRGGTPFKWPKKSRTKKPRPPSWSKRKEYEFFLRVIHMEKPIEWGEPYKMFDDKEIIKYMENAGFLRHDWRDHYQSFMRQHS